MPAFKLLPIPESLPLPIGCAHRFCFACKEAPHEPATCKVAERFAVEREGARLAGELDSSRWITENTTACISCSAPVSRTSGCNHMRCSRCQGEFCYACGAAWDNSHYGCARSAAQDDGANFNKDDVRAWSLGGYDRWEGIAARQGPGFWRDLLRDGKHLPAALPLLEEAQTAALHGAEMMRNSFMVDLAIPEGLEYTVARKRLRVLRADLEGVLTCLVHIVLPRNVTGMDGRLDLRRPLAVAYAIEGSEASRARLEAQAAAVRQVTSRMELSMKNRENGS